MKRKIQECSFLISEKNIYTKNTPLGEILSDIEKNIMPQLKNKDGIEGELYHAYRKALFLKDTEKKYAEIMRIMIPLLDEQKEYTGELPQGKDAEKLFIEIGREEFPEISKINNEKLSQNLEENLTKNKSFESLKYRLHSIQREYGEDKKEQLKQMEQLIGECKKTCTEANKIIEANPEDIKILYTLISFRDRISGMIAREKIGQLIEKRQEDLRNIFQE